MEFITKTWHPSEHTRKLLAARGTENAGSVEWNVASAPDLTEAEMKALRRKHNTRNVNYRRAAEVKALMVQGRKCMEIVHALHRQYRKTQVKKDHSALLPYCGQGRG